MSAHLRALFKGSAVGGHRGVPAGALRHRPGVRRRDISARVESTLEAEQKAARSLGVGPMTVQMACHQLWGRSLTDERESRVKRRARLDASPRSLQAQRGHVTRELMAELQSVLGKPRHRKNRKGKK